MERLNSSASPQKKGTETNVASTEMMDPKQVPESPIEVNKAIVEHTIPQEDSRGSDLEDKIVSEDNDGKEIVLDPPIEENVVKIKESEEQLTFSDTEGNSEFKIREIDTKTASDLTIVEENVIETVKHEVHLDSQTEASTNEVKNSDVSQNTSHARDDISGLTIKDNLIIQTVIKRDEQDGFTDTNVLPTHNEIDGGTPTLDNETVLYNPNGLIEEVYTSTSQQLDSVIVSCGDSNPNNILKGGEFPDMNLSDQKISDSSGYARDKEALSCEATFVSNSVDDPDLTLTYDVGTVSEIIGTCVESEVPATTESDVPATTESDVPASTESDVPAATEYLKDSPIKQPEVISTDLPATTESDVPATTESDVPATTEYLKDSPIKQPEVISTELPGQETVFTKPAGLIEEVLTSTSQQLNSVIETCGDSSPKNSLKGEEFPDMNSSYQNIPCSFGDARDREDLLCDMTLVSNAIEGPEATLTQDLETELIGDSPIRENIAEQRSAITQTETMLSSGETVTSEVMGTCIESGVPATTESDVPATTESDVPATTVYLDDLPIEQYLPGIPIKPFIAPLQTGVISTDQQDILSGTSKETKPRRSVLRNFDPLLCNSPIIITTPILQDVQEDIHVVADSPTLHQANDTFEKTGILIDLSAIVIPDQEDTDNLIVNDGESIIKDIVVKVENQAVEEKSLTSTTATELEKQEVEETKESVGTQTSSEHRKKRARYSDSRESLRVHCNDSSQSFNEEYFEAQSVLQRHIERSLKGFVNFGPREESDIEGRVFEIEPQVYEDESELSKTPVRKRSPTRKKAHKQESSGEETREEQSTHPPKYLHVLEKQRRDIEDIQIITSDSETDIEIKKKRVLTNDDIKITKEVCEKVKHHDEPSKKKKTPEKIKLIVDPHNVSITEEQGDKITKKIVKDNKYTESEKSSYKETSESEHGKVRVTKKFVKKKGDSRLEIDTNKEEEKLSEPQEEECALEEKYLIPFIQKLAVTTPHSKMADLSEKLNEQQQENSELKLQLNASQQAKASLELEIRQKEEIIIKTQAEALKNEQIYKQELKQLKEKLKENSKLIEKDTTKELEEQLKEAKARELKAAAELAQKNNKDIDYQKMMNQYESTLKNKCAENQKLAEELDSVKTHLSNLELAFSDLHLKYEKTKESLQACKANEETLLYQLSVTEQTNVQQEEKYESLMVHAKSQIERSNRDNLTLTESYEGELSKLKAIIKRLEIKCSSLESTLQQKTAECEALAALCDEVTGKKV